MPSKQGQPAGQGLLLDPVRVGREKSLSTAKLPPSQPRQMPPRGVCKAGASPATSVGTPPAHSILLWRPALFGQVTLAECSTMLLHTPGLLLCYENKTKHARERSGEVGVRGVHSEPATHSPFLSGLHSKDGSSAVPVRAASHVLCLENNIFAKRRPGHPGCMMHVGPFFSNPFVGLKPALLPEDTSMGHMTWFLDTAVPREL